MEALPSLLCVLNLLRYPLEAAARQHHLLHWETHAAWKQQQVSLRCIVPPVSIHHHFLYQKSNWSIINTILLCSWINQTLGQIFWWAKCRRITCVCRAEDLQEDRRALPYNTGLGGHGSQSRQTPPTHCMMGMLLRSHSVAVLIHGLWAEEREDRGLLGISLI